MGLLSRRKGSSTRRTPAVDDAIDTGRMVRLGQAGRSGVECQFLMG